MRCHKLAFPNGEDKAQPHRAFEAHLPQLAIGKFAITSYIVKLCTKGVRIPYTS